ncbi:hypothetical protein VPH35_112662 [Triticum aestivum]
MQRRGDNTQGMAAWRCCAAVDAAAVQGNKPRRRAWRDWCVLWLRTGGVGCVGTAGALTSVRLTLGGGVCRRCARVRARDRLHPSGVCRWRLLDVCHRSRRRRLWGHRDAAWRRTKHCCNGSEWRSMRRHAVEFGGARKLPARWARGTAAAAARVGGVHGDIDDDGLTCCSSWLRG